MPVLTGCQGNRSIASNGSASGTNEQAQQAAKKFVDLLISHCGAENRWGLDPVGLNIGHYTLAVEGGPPDVSDGASRLIGYEWIGSVTIHTANPGVDGQEFDLAKRSGVWYYVLSEYTLSEGGEVTREIPFSELRAVRPGCGS
jgi:hypothetical protein